MASPFLRVAATAVGVATLGLAACTDDGATAPDDAISYQAVNQMLTQNCGSCHGAGSGRFFLTTMDSAALVESGLVNAVDAQSSLLLQKPRNLIPHGGGLIAAFTAEDQAIVSQWITLLPPASGVSRLQALRIGTGTGIQAPVVDGFFDPVWALAPEIRVRVTGGFGEAEFASLKAAYDDTYLYMVVSWDDDQASIMRQPWAKKADGSWATLPAKPAPANGTTWAQLMEAFPNEEDPARFAYEDKFALIWNTYGPSTIAGFDQAGCAVLCHDPSQAGRPGTSYNSTGELAAKKYTNAANEVGDMWHWKLVRNNQHNKMDDQNVTFWVPGPTGAADGGRHSDPGAAGYGNNPALNGRPQYRGASLTAPPYYIYDNQKVALTDEVLNGLSVGTLIANMITSGPTGARADIDAKGLHNGGHWNVEIRRRLVTGDPLDVQFDNLGRDYAFGVSIFDNAQIEHRYLPTVAFLRFTP